MFKKNEDGDLIATFINSQNKHLCFGISTIIYQCTSSTKVRNFNSPTNLIWVILSFIFLYTPWMPAQNGESR